MVNLNKVAGAMGTAAIMAGEILTPDPSYGQQPQPFHAGRIPERYCMETGTHFYANIKAGGALGNCNTTHYLKAFPSVNGTDFWLYGSESLSCDMPPPPVFGAGIPVELGYRDGSGLYLLPTVEFGGGGKKDATLYGTLVIDKYFADFNPTFSMKDGSFEGTSLNVGQAMKKFNVMASASYSARDGRFGPVYGRVMFPVLYGLDVDIGAGYGKSSGANFRLSVSGRFGKIHRGHYPAGPAKGPTLRVAGHDVYSAHPPNRRRFMKGHCPYESSVYKPKPKFYRRM